MNLRSRLRVGWTTTLGIHVAQCAFAACFALPFVASISVPGILVRPLVAEWIGALRLGEGVDLDSVRRVVPPLAAAALNYPWLSVAWLRALDREDSFTVHARFALGRYRAGLGIASASVLAMAAIGACFGLSSYLIGRFGAEQLDARARDLARGLSLLASACAAVWAVTLQDAAYAAVSRNVSGARAIARAARTAARPRLVAQRAGLVCLSASMTIAAWAVPRLAFGPNAAADFAVLVATQCCALLLTCSRAVWLAWVLEKTGRESASNDWREPGE